MKFKNKPKKGLKISIAILLSIIILLIIVNIIPNGTDKIKNGFLLENGGTPLWKKICYVIAGTLFIINFFVCRIMCHCQHCGKYISMNINIEYCPYCSNKIDK